MQSYHWILWNVMLAAVPAACAYVMEAGLKVARKLHIPAAVVLAPLAPVWLAFLPNSCYLLTEWRHFLFDRPYTAMRAAAAVEHIKRLDVAVWGLYFVLYAAIGALCFGLAIRPVARMMGRRRALRALAAVPFFFLVSLGVYLGLIVRLNSWDLARRPALVLQSAQEALSRPILANAILVFAVLLYLLYMTVDVWIDGLALRIGSVHLAGRRSG
ncbi:MAG: DUF1361 domain-containing protein [Armatimonadetes bacterium]|nr:DUF1361 domain-containing protein [Armatimonadota bacterium]MDE2206605.1 DUF1361 domain-containing protein [Armatimonadota bacterium]